MNLTHWKLYKNEYKYEFICISAITFANAIGKPTITLTDRVHVVGLNLAATPFKPKLILSDELQTDKVPFYWVYINLIRSTGRQEQSNQNNLSANSA